MNKAFIMIAIPAFSVSFCWLTYDYGWKVALPVTIVELAIAIWGLFYLRRREARAAKR